MNKLVSNEHQELYDEDLILILNEAQNHLVKSKLGLNNVYKSGLDSFKKRYQDLQTFIEPYTQHKLKLEKKDQYIHRYTFDLPDLNPKFMLFIDAYVRGTKNKCKDQILYLDRPPLRHDSISTLLDSTIYKPSYEWRRVLADISKSEIGFYTDGTFEIDTAYLSYLRYPKQMDIAGYVNLDGTPSVDQDSELEDYLEDELLNFAELSAGMSTNNVSSVQNAQNRINASE
jgi:hypothetical protein